MPVSLQYNPIGTTDGKGLLRTYEGRRFFAWFDRYLKGKKVSTGPRFAYYRDWVPFNGKGPDTQQYGHAARVAHNGKPWSDVETDLESGWTKARSETTAEWHHIRDAVHAAYTRHRP